MKTSITVFTIIALLLCILPGCSADSAYSENSGKLKVIATVFPLYDFAKNIAGDRADVSLLLPSSADSHSYEPTPHDIIRIRECDVFLYIGGADDSWVEKILAEQENVKSVRLMNSVTLLEEEIVEGMETQEHDHEHESADNSDNFDQHIWTSPPNAVLMTRAIADALSDKDSENAEFYKNNAEEYIKKLEELDNAFTGIISNASRNVIVFADRFAFRYLADCYGLEYYAAFPGCSEESEPSAMTIAFLIEKIRREQIPVVFYGELSDKKTANTISRETDALPMLLHSCHTVTQEEIDSGKGYIDFMRENAETLRIALE
ncbi:MAG: metal ABC transporter substrate-binding protein [Oscillospiraceae bacterium]|nr:metal ABC transporter substrate-binding protein [Oscillospiraceae bacterium]